MPICCDNCERKVKAALTHVEGEFFVNSPMLHSYDSGGIINLGRTLLICWTDF